MSTRESWPGEQPDVSAVEDEVEAAEEEVAETYDDENAAGDAGEGAGDETGEASEAEAADEEPQRRVAEPASTSDLDVPDDVDLLEGEARSARRGVGIVAARANGEIVNKLLASALGELDELGVASDSITVMAVPGPFELPLGAMALAKTRRYSCVVALGCVIGDGLVAGEAASGLQLAGLETGVPVSFGVLAVDTAEEAEERTGAGAEAVRTALEMADVFSLLRASAQAK